MYKPFHQAVRDICSKNGWEVKSVHNEKRTHCVRRLSYKGHFISEGTEQDIRIAVRFLVNVFNINGAVYWHNDRLCVDIHSEDVEY